MELSFGALISAAGERSPPVCPAGMDGPLAVQAEIAGSISPVRNMRKAVSGQLISKHLQRGLEHRANSASDNKDYRTRSQIVRRIRLQCLGSKKDRFSE